jgi:hypothetical protein
LVYLEGSHLRLLSRNGREMSESYPELRALLQAVGGHRAVLDEEIVVLGPGGKPGFSVMAQRMHVRSSGQARRLRQTIPVHYVVFDLLFWDGQDLTGVALEERRGRLESLLHFQPPVVLCGDHKPGAFALCGRPTAGPERDRRQAVEQPVCGWQESGLAESEDQAHRRLRDRWIHPAARQNL